MERMSRRSVVAKPCEREGAMGDHTCPAQLQIIDSSASEDKARIRLRAQRRRMVKTGS